MSQSPSGMKSDYRGERWAARIIYVHEHFKDWLFYGGTGIVALFVLFVWVSLSIELWAVGAGWATILMLGGPLVAIGWIGLLDWSDKRLEQARKERSDYRDDWDY